MNSVLIVVYSQTKLTLHEHCLFCTGLDKSLAVFSNLIPCVQEHDIRWLKIILVKVCDFSDNKASSLVGAFKEPWLDIFFYLLKPGGKT